MADYCVELVTRLAGERQLEVPDDELKSLIKNFRKEVGRRKIRSPEDVQTAFDVAFGKTTEMRLAARQQKREAMIRLVKFKNAEAKIKKYVEDSGGKVNEADALEAILVGDSTLITGSRDSVAARKGSLESQFIGSLNKQLGEELESILRRGDLDDEITLYQYNRNANVSEKAKQIHKVLYDHANGRRERENRAGAFIREREDHLGKQSHDRQKIAKTPREEWKADVRRLVDEKETFGKFNTEEDVDAYLDELYKRFSLGKHYTVEDGDAVPTGAPKNINLAKKLSQSRTIHFRDGEAALDYAKKYSEPSIWNRYVDGIRYDARSIALLEAFGPNPKAMKESLVSLVDRMAFERGVSISDAKKKFLDSQYDMVNGSLDIPANVTLAEISNAVRVIENVSKLGGAVISAFGDVVFKGVTLNRRTDMGFFGSYLSGITNMTKGLNRADSKHVGNMADVYAEVTLGSVHTRAGAIDGMPGLMSKLNEQFFRWNLLQGWTVSHKRGLAAAAQVEYGRYKNTAFDKLPDNTRRSLEMHNISADEWATMRGMDTKSPEKKIDFIYGSGVYTIPDEIVDQAIVRMQGTTDITENMRMSFRDELAIKIQTLIHDITDEGVVTPDDKTRVILTAGAQKGTLFGEFMRIATQFKSFPVAVIQKQILPQYRSAGGGLKGIAALTPIILGTTLLGYVSGAAKDIVKGKEPKDPRGIKPWLDAMLRGGGLGIYGDFMFAEYSKFGRSFQQTLLGPGIGTFSEFLAQTHKSAMKLPEGEVDAAGWFKFIESTTPGANLFYLENAFNYFIFNSLIEAAEPGYLRRQEKRIRREYDQEYWLPPASAF